MFCTKDRPAELTAASTPPVFLRELFFGQRNLMALGLAEKPGIYISLARKALTRLILFSKESMIK